MKTIENLARAVDAVRALLQSVPNNWRSKIYDGFAVLSGLAAIVTFIFANDTVLLGLEVPERWMSLVLAIGTVFGALARANTVTDPPSGGRKRNRR